MARTILIGLLILSVSSICAGGEIIFVDDDGPADFNNIQAAINDANDGDIIEVQPGTYTGPGNRDLDFGGKAITVSGTNPEDWAVVEATVVDCQGSGRGFHFHSGEGPSSVVAGLTITNGSADKGAGIYCDGADPIIEDCSFAYNSAGSFAGGVYCCTSSPTISRCTFTGNSAEGTDYQDGGGGIGCLTAGDPLISHCIFKGNVASRGGGLHYLSLSPSYITIINCTFHNNLASEYAGAVSIYGYIDSHALVRNCIVWGNEPDDDSGVVSLACGKCGSPQVRVDFSILQSDWQNQVEINNCLVADPCFADAESGDYHLQSQAGRWDPNTQSWVTDANMSICIDAGDPSSDWTAELWPHGKQINIGAYGGTAQASMSMLNKGNIADLTANDLVNFQDFAPLAGSWNIEKILLPEDLDRNAVVDFNDLAIFAENWLEEYMDVLVETDKSVYEPNETIVVSFSNAAGNKHDWIGICRRGAVHCEWCGVMLDWFYTDGTKTGTEGIINGSVTFDGLPDEGDYETRLFFDDSYILEARTYFTVESTP